MSGDPTNPKGVTWLLHEMPLFVADTLETFADDSANIVHLSFGMTVGDVVMPIVKVIVQRDVAEAFGGSLLSLGNKPRPGE